MKLRIIKWKNVINHCESNRAMLRAFERFYEIASDAEWLKPQDMMDTFNKTDLITCKKQNTTRIVFDIGYNKYRLITGYYFATNQTILYVKFVGTHKEYDLINVCSVDMFKQ